MKPTVIAIGLVITIFVFAFSIGGTTADNAAANTAPENAQAAQGDKPTGRFQISSFATPKSGSGVGYYVIDSTTGEIWMNNGNNKPSKVSESLLQ